MEFETSVKISIIIAFFILFAGILDELSGIKDELIVLREVIQKHSR